MDLVINCGLMVLNISDFGIIIKLTEKEYYTIIMVIFSKGYSWIKKQMVMENIFIIMELVYKDSGKKIFYKDLEYKYIRVDQNIMKILLMEISKE